MSHWDLIDGAKTSKNSVIVKNTASVTNAVLLENLRSIEIIYLILVVYWMKILLTHVHV